MLGAALIVFAVDPGGGTGCATYDSETGDFRSWEEHGFLAAAKSISETMPNVDACVCENYIVTARTSQLTQQTEPLRLIGVTEWEASLCNIPFKLQQPSARKPATDTVLKTLGWFVKTKDMHSADAARHLFVFCARMGLLTEDARHRLKKSLS